MPRKRRIHYPKAIYHVMLRGNAKQNIFFDDSDRFKLADLLKEACENYQCEVYAFCFMTNHIHLMIRISDIPLAKIIHNIAFRYATWINIKLNRVGHLFQGRYKAILVDTELYLKKLIQYIHLNPVAAKLIKNPSDTWWSSHCDYLGACIHPWVNTNYVLSIFSPNRQTAIKLYREMINAEVIDPHDEIEEYLLTTELSISLKQADIVDFVCQKYKVTKTLLLSPCRNRLISEARVIIVWLCKELNLCSLR
ncbi:MAG: transposase, Tnp [Gammaproteobacteria bacterium]|jgi:REP element-mobilizing transposase RayT|nr:transposase, Tnp [Gammaproteobacteria bacterium]